MLTTSFETCTATSVTALTPFHLRVTLDLAVTSTASEYRTAGQWVWIKPWGDEDGNLAPCALTHAPDGASVTDVALRRGGAVADAVEAGEMLEVSEVCGEGFGPGVGGAVGGAEAVWGFAAAESVLALASVLSGARGNVSVFVCVREEDVREFEDCFEVEEGNEVQDFGVAAKELVEAWGLGCDVRVVKVGERGMGGVVEDIGKAPEGCVAVMACPWKGLEGKLREECGVVEVFVNDASDL